jgi:signal peptidase II
MPSPLTENFRSPAALARFFLTTLVGFSLDLWTKALAFQVLATYPDGRLASKVYQLIPGYLHFTVTTNTGAVFGLGQGQRALFLLVSLAAIAFLTYLFATSDNQRFYQFILGMLLAGVLGNMYDRFVFGHVRDMIHALPRYPTLFPWIFNVADVLLCTGVGLLLIYSLLHPRHAPPRRNPSSPPSSN